MRIDLAVLESLGINLYSNAAAVLAEVVANAWDADANSVKIDWNQQSSTITINDDGTGMTLRQLNERYLTVGYQKRDEEGKVSDLHQRPFMGRKGIGKLSVFSLADDVEVFSAREGEKNGLKIAVKDLRKSIELHEEYHPAEISIPSDMQARGTRIILTNLNKKRSAVPMKALRRRIARRFDVLNFAKSDPARFEIVLDGKRVGIDDREDLKRLEYVWHLGRNELTKKQLPKAKRQWVLDATVDKGQGWALEGWFGTVEKPEDLKDPDDPQESLRNIIILARKRPIQEGILDQLDFNKIFASYVTGQIRAEFLDIDGESDIATSDRQRLMEDDPRVEQLIKTLRQKFNEASEQWSKQRPKDKFKALTNSYPAIQTWASNRPESQRAAAKKMIATIASLRVEHESERRELYRAGVLAFERVALQAGTEQFEKLASVTAADILPLLATQRSYEDALYVQILRSRLEAITQLEKLINGDVLEAVLQTHLFDNMWILDPSWEGATGNKNMELRLKDARAGLFDVNEEAEKAQGRIDISYRNTAGSHMIIELKKYERKVSIAELVEQGSKYHEALTEVLYKQGVKGARVETVFVLGERPKAGYLGSLSYEDFLAKEMSPINGRVLYYDELLKNAQAQYEEYTNVTYSDTDLDRVLQSLDANSAEDAPAEEESPDVVGESVDSVQPDPAQEGADPRPKPTMVAQFIARRTPIN